MPTLGHVLLVRTDHLGDMILTLPMVDALKAADPSCRVSVLASAANAEAARHHPRVDHVEVDALEAKGSSLHGLPRLIAQLRAVRCDAAVVVHPTPRLALAIVLAGVPVRVGTAYRGYSLLFNRRVRQHRRHPPWKHESEYNIALLEPLGVRPSPAQPMTWKVAEDEAAVVESLLRDRGVVASRIVVLHPGNAGSAMNWGPEQYAELGRRLVSPTVRIAITGTDPEAELTGVVAKAIGPAALDLAGALTLAQFAALLRRSALYIGSSTGPTHLAAAVGTPVIAVYSPLQANAPQRWRPLGPQVQLFQPRVDLVCPKCLGERCPYYHCMERHLSIDEVAAAAQRVLKVSGS